MQEALTESMCDVMGLMGINLLRVFLHVVEKMCQEVLGYVEKNGWMAQDPNSIPTVSCSGPKDEFSQQNPVLSSGEKKRRNVYFEIITFLFFFHSQNILFILHLEIVSDIAGC